LFDTLDWNYRNTLLWGIDGANYFVYRTTDWIQNPLLDKSLVDKLMESKFRLYRIARQKIKLSNYVTTNLLQDQFRVTEIWVDENQGTSAVPKTFILAEDVYSPDQDKHTITLFEYDDAETINLV